MLVDASLLQPSLTPGTPAWVGVYYFDLEANCIAGLGVDFCGYGYACDGTDDDIAYYAVSMLHVVITMLSVWQVE